METLRRKYGYNKNDKILVTTGFIFSFKKIPEILTNLIPNLKSDSSIKIQLLNAITPRFYHLCYQESKRVGAIIEEHNLYNQVSFITRFLSEQELRERIYLSDIGFTWFDAIVHSISATEKEFISARIPLVVNSNSHFNLTSGVLKVPADLKVFTQEMIALLHNTSDRWQLQAQAEELYEQNWDRQVNEYLDIFNLFE